MQLFQAVLVLDALSFIGYGFRHLVAKADPASSRSRHMLEFLTGFKINDEPSDRVTVDVNAAMAEVPQNRRSFRMSGRGTHLGY